MAEGVISTAAVGVGEDLVGLGGLLELLLRLRVVLVDVGVQLARQPAERRLDHPVAGSPAHAEDLVVVALHLS